MDSALDKPGPSGEGQERGDGPQKVFINPSNTNEVLPSSEKMQLPRGTGNKMKVIAFIAEAHKEILYKMLGDQADPFDISIGDQIHNVLSISFTILQQRYNRTGSTLQAQTATTSFKVSVDDNDYTIGKDDILKIVQQKAIDLEIPFARYERKDPNNWYGRANSLLQSLSGFRLRRKELRLGHHYMLVEGRNNVKGKIRLSDYGIDAVHHTLCAGVTFPPKNRVAMPQTLGALTTLLCYIKSDSRSSQKWAHAVKRTFADFPQLDDVMQVLKEEDPMVVGNLIKLIGHVALIATTGQIIMMYPPPAAFSYIFTTERHTVGSSIYETKDLLETFNMTDHGAFAFYKIFMSLTWKIRLSGATDSLAKQIVYHSMFGSYNEDLSILAQITNQAKWNTLGEMYTVFERPNTKLDVISFVPVKMKFYSKLSQESQTSLLTQVKKKKSKRKFNDAFFDSLRSEQNEKVVGKSLQALIKTYITTIDDLEVMLKAQRGIIKVGTGGWYNMEKLTPTSYGEEEADLNLEGTGQYFQSEIVDHYI